MLEIEKIVGLQIGEMINPDFNEIATMLCQFHQIRKEGDQNLCHIDNNPRNYLYSEEKDQYFMIDFADCRMDYLEWDLTGFLLFWASMVNVRRFKDIVHEFLEGYLSKELFNDKRFADILKQNIKIFDLRRKKFNIREPLPNANAIENRLVLFNEMNSILKRKELK